MQSSTRLRELLKTNKTLVAPASYDCLSAKLIEKAGLKATFLSGFCLNASTRGMPDLGMEGRAEVVERARQICAAVEIPVIVDAGNGYGDAAGTWQTVRELEQVGAAGCFIEDQAYPSACPGLKTPEVIPMEEFMPKLRAALDARKNKDFLIAARTDAGATLGLDEAIRRCRSFVEAGADMVVCVAGVPRNREGMLDVYRRIGVPMGPMPPFYEAGVSLQDYEALGNMKILSGLETVMTVAKSLKELYEGMAQTGVPDESRGLTMNEWMDVMELGRWIGIEKAYL